MVEKTKSEQIVVENVKPKQKQSTKDDIKFVGNELVRLSDRINEIELSMESLRQDINRVMGRMGL